MPSLRKLQKLSQEPLDQTGLFVLIWRISHAYTKYWHKIEQYKLKKYEEC